jgi:hypothetical protein
MLPTITATCHLPQSGSAGASQRPAHRSDRYTASYISDIVDTICIHIYIYYNHVYTYVCIFILYIIIDIHVHTCICICMYVYIYIHTCIWACTYTVFFYSLLKSPFCVGRSSISMGYLNQRYVELPSGIHRHPTWHCLSSCSRKVSSGMRIWDTYMWIPKTPVNGKSLKKIMENPIKSL